MNDYFSLIMIATARRINTTPTVISIILKTLDSPKPSSVVAVHLKV